VVAVGSEIAAAAPAGSTEIPRAIKETARRRSPPQLRADGITYERRDRPTGLNRLPFQSLL
jgi:hypothetical protein